MEIHNVEIKAKVSENQYQKIKQYLDMRATVSKGEDTQHDHYFYTKKGKLKLRIGNIENSLIYYDRTEVKGLKNSKITLHKVHGDPHSLLDILSKTQDLIKIIKKQRRIYFIDNVKFHLDRVQGFGTFAEIEAISENNAIEKKTLQEQCLTYMEIFGLNNEMLVDKSYADMTPSN